MASTSGACQVVGGSGSANTVVLDVKSHLLAHPNPPLDQRVPQRRLTESSVSPSHPRQHLAVAGKVAVVVACVAIFAIVCLFAPALNFPGASFGVHAAREGSDVAPVRFFTIGDWGRDGAYNQSRLAKQMGSIGRRQRVQFVVSVGDNFYDDGLSDVDASRFYSSFSAVYNHRSLQVPWYAVLGNHDYYGNALAQLHPELANRDPRWVCRRSMALSLPLCHQKKGVDCTDFVDLFFYDSTPLIPSYRHKRGRRVDWRGLNAANWTQQEEAQLQELDGWLRNSLARWKVVIGHHPVFSFGSHGDQQEMIDKVKPIMERHGVDAYLNGHDHNCQHVKKNESRVHYFTMGGGSKSWSTKAPARAPGLKYFFPGQGFGALEVSRKALQVSFYGVSGDRMYTTTITKTT